MRMQTQTTHQAYDGLRLGRTVDAITCIAVISEEIHRSCPKRACRTSWDALPRATLIRVANKSSDRGQEEPGTVVVDPASRHLYFVEAPGQSDPLWRWRRSRGLRLVGNGKDQHAAQLARLGAAEGDGRPRSADPLATRGDVARAGRSRRSEKPAWGEGDVSLRRRRGHGLSHPRHDRT